MDIEDLPEWLQDMVDSCPRSGGGVHSWLFNTARQLHWHCPDKAELADLLEEKSADCGRDVPRREIEAAVLDSEGAMWKPGESNAQRDGEDEDEERPEIKQKSARRPPSAEHPAGLGLNRIKLDLPKLEEIVVAGPRLADLRPRSPFPCGIPAGLRMSSLVVRGLFGESLLCCGWSQWEFDTRTLEEWGEELQGKQFIVPNPMSARLGYTKDGKLSAHTLDNTQQPRLFLIGELDFGLVERDGKTRKPCADFVEEMAAQGITIADISASVLLHLSEYAPLVLIVSSGGKSLHGWFYCAGQEEETLLSFFKYAISLGADWRMWLPSQFARMPDGTRDNGKRQEVHYFDPRPIFNFNQPFPGTFLTMLAKECSETQV
jgi:hypothetical protein